MAKMVSEIAQGQQYQYSSGDAGTPPTASQTRVFKVLLERPAEFVDLQSVCGIFIGDAHPETPGLFCQSYGAQFDGDSRMVIVVTFTYLPIPLAADNGGGGGGGGSSGGGGQPPDIRPANWSISSSAIEVPVRSWYPRVGIEEWEEAEPAANPVGDLYDGITALRPIVTINITQFDLLDPTRHAEHVGTINSEEIKLGSLTMAPHTLLFRGLTVQSQVKPWGRRGVFRGWESNYEFAYTKNLQRVHYKAADVVGTLGEVPLGWDMAVPLTGWNVHAVDPASARAKDDVWGQPLLHNYPNEEQGIAIDSTKPLKLPKGTADGEKVRAMVKVFSYKANGFSSQAPSASPVALNEDGTPRKLTADRKPLIFAYQVHEAINFTETLGLRLYGY